MRLLSVNVGTPRRVQWHGREVTTAIFKHPVDGPRFVSEVVVDAGCGAEDVAKDGG